MIRILFWSSLCALTINIASAQMGGGMGAAEEVVIPEVDGESWIWLTPEKWYPYSKTSELKNDAYLFPTGQKPQKWKEMLQLEQFNSTLGLTDADQAFELKTQNLAGCEVEKIIDQSENGYPMNQWVERCASSDGETMVTVRKAVLGNERFYLASRIWKSEPKESEMEKWLDYLDTIYVCDGTRQHDCTPPSAGGGGGGMGGSMGGGGMGGG